MPHSLHRGLIKAIVTHGKLKLKPVPKPPVKPVTPPKADTLYRVQVRGILSKGKCGQAGGRVERQGYLH